MISDGSKDRYEMYNLFFVNMIVNTSSPMSFDIATSLMHGVNVALV